MKRFAFIAATLAALAIFTPPANACDGVAALGTGCYSQSIRQRVKIVERVAAPQYQIVERIEVPQYVERVEVQRVEVPYVQRIEKVRRVEKVRVVERQRDAYPLRSSLRASVSIPARVVERLAAPRSKVIRRERIVERSIY